MDVDLYAQIKSGAVRVTKKSSLPLRFWSRVDKDGPVHPIVGQCWQWTGYATKQNGHGQIAVGRTNLLAHRFSWEWHYGEVPTGLCVLHRCDNRRCVNPEHLFLGTVLDNVKDMIEKGRQAPPKLGEDSHCAKLTEIQVAEIRRRYKRYSQTDGGGALGKEFGVTQAQISNIIHYKAWGHV
jgi:hypothetical protein